MKIGLIFAAGALAVTGAAVTPAPAEARTYVSIGVGSPGYYGGGYGYYGRPYYVRPYYGGYAYNGYYGRPYYGGYDGYYDVPRRYYRPRYHRGYERRRWRYRY